MEAYPKGQYRPEHDLSLSFVIGLACSSICNGDVARPAHWLFARMADGEMRSFRSSSLLLRSLSGVDHSRYQAQATV